MSKQLRILAPEINIEKRNSYAYPNYRLDRIPQQANGDTVTLLAAGGNNSLFEIPAVVGNMNRSILAFDMNITAQAADNVNAFRHLIPQIRHIQYYNRNNVMLADITDFDRFSKIILASDSTLEDLLTNSGEYPLVRSNALRNNVNAERPISADASLHYTEQMYVQNAGDNVAITVRYRIPMGIFKNTFFALNQDIYFGDITYLRIYYQSAGNVGFDSDDAAYTNPGALVGPITLTNLQFYHAVETNEAMIATIKSTFVNTGLSYLIDWVHVDNTSLTGTSQSFYVKYGRTHGRTLKRIYWCQTPTAPATPNLLYETAIGDGVNIVSFYTRLDGQRIIQYDIQCTEANGNQDYMLMKDKMKGNSYQNIDIYKYNWFWCESFDGLKLIEHEDTLETGLSLDVEKKYDVDLRTANTPFTYYIFAVTQKELLIGPMGITVT